MMFAMMVAALGLTACGGDSDDDAHGVSELTSDAIVELLEGKWDVHGKLRFNMHFDIDEFSVRSYSYEGNYKGTIEFYKDKKFVFKITEYDNDRVKATYKDNTTKYESGRMETYYYNYVPSSSEYIIKKGNKNYIVFRADTEFSDFEIMSLKTNSFKLVLDKENSSKLEKHIANIKEQYNNLNLIYADKVEDKTSHFDNNLSLLKSCLLNQNSIVENYLELSNFEVNQKILPVINKYLNESLQCMEFLIGLLK